MNFNSIGCSVESCSITRLELKKVSLFTFFENASKTQEISFIETKMTNLVSNNNEDNEKFASITTTSLFKYKSQPYYRSLVLKRVKIVLRRLKNITFETKVPLDYKVKQCCQKLIFILDGW